MKNLIFKGSHINAGNHIISISIFDTRDVAIISKTTGDFCKFSDAKKGGKIDKIRRMKMFKNNLNSKETATFQFMQHDIIMELIKFLRK